MYDGWYGGTNWYHSVSPYYSVKRYGTVNQLYHGRQRQETMTSMDKDARVDGE